MKSDGIRSPRVWLETLIEPENLAGRGSRHWGQEERVPETSLGNPLFQRSPVPQRCGGNSPEVILKLTLRSWATFVRLIRTICLGHLATGLEGSMVDGLENLNIEFLGSCGVERHAEHHESIGKTLHTNSDWSMAHVGLPRFRDGVVVDVDDAVQIECDNLSNAVQLLEVVLPVGDKGRECDRRKVANRSLIWGGVLNDLRAQIGRFDRSQVLLVRLG